MSKLATYTVFVGVRGRGQGSGRESAWILTTAKAARAVQGWCYAGSVEDNTRWTTCREHSRESKFVNIFPLFRLSVTKEGQVALFLYNTR